MYLDPKIEEVLEKIHDDEYLLEEALNISDVDELYEFCREVNGEEDDFVSFGEFLRFYDRIFDSYESNPEIIKKINDELLDKIDGGNLKDNAKKIISTSLAALTMASSGGTMLMNNPNQTVSAFSLSGNWDNNEIKVIAPWEIKEIRKILLPESFSPNEYFPKVSEDSEIFKSKMRKELLKEFEEEKTFKGKYYPLEIDDIVNRTWTIYKQNEAFELYNNAYENLKNDSDLFTQGDEEGNFLNDEGNWNKFIANSRDSGSEDYFDRITKLDKHPQQKNGNYNIGDKKRMALFMYYQEMLKRNYPNLNINDSSVYSSKKTKTLRNNQQFRKYCDSFGTFTATTGSSFYQGKAKVSGSMALGEIIEEQVSLSEKGYPNLINTFKMPALFLIGFSITQKGTEILKTGANWLGKGADFIKSRLYNRNIIEKDPVKLKELIEEKLKQKLFGQENAINKISNCISGMSEKWRDSDKNDTPCTEGCTMAWIGPSGVGKTFAINALSETLFGTKMQPWQTVTSTAVKPTCVDAKTNETLTPADQLFNVNSKIYQQLRGNPRVVICIDEIDKMAVNDPNNTILERLRDVRDTGKLLIRDGSNYKYIDVSRTIFVVISNETRESWNLPAVKLSDIEMKSRTQSKRDVSLTNRFDIVEFEFLKAPTYKMIANKELETIKNYYKNDYEIDVQFDDKFVDSISEACENVNKGVRGVNDYINQIRGKLVEYRSQNSEFSGSSVKLTYESENGTINVSKV